METCELSTDKTPAALMAAEIPPRPKKTVYPAQFAARVDGRIKTPLGDVFGLRNFGVNVTRLKPGSESALRHAHMKQDEFVYILEGEPVLITNEGETKLKPGMCAGFKAATGDAHHLVNRGSRDVVYLEIGDRTEGEEVVYPDDDLLLTIGPDGKYRVTRKDGTPFT
jgi:uncharacterized cupin superfamily protein